MEKAVTCIGITYAITPDGKRRVQLSFGRNLDPLKHQTPQGIPITHDADMILFLEEPFFEEVKSHFLLGQSYTFGAGKGSISLK